jgi:hypothetical protein
MKTQVILLLIVYGVSLSGRNKGLENFSNEENIYSKESCNNIGRKEIRIDELDTFSLYRALVG